jgi:transposase
MALSGVNVWASPGRFHRATGIGDVDFDESDTFIVHVRSRRSTQRRRGRRGMRVPGYDRGVGAQLVGAWPLTLRCFLQADTPWVNCPVHGPTVT